MSWWDGTFVAPKMDLQVAIYSNGSDLAGAPRLSTQGNLMPGERQLIGQPILSSDTVPSGIMYLALPALTDIRGINSGGPDTVIVPKGTHRKYICLWADDYSKGYNTEHRIAILQQANPFYLDSTGLDYIDANVMQVQATLTAALTHYETYTAAMHCVASMTGASLTHYANGTANLADVVTVTSALTQTSSPIAPYAILQKVHGSLGSTSTSYTITYPVTTTAGSLLVIYSGTKGTGSGSHLGGSWNIYAVGDGNNNLETMFWGNASATSTVSVLLSGTVTEIEYVAFELAPIASTPLDVGFFTNAGSSSSPSIANANTAQPDLGLVGFYAPATFSSPTNSWTAMDGVSGSTFTLQVYGKALSNIATQTCGATASGSVVWFASQGFVKHS